MTKLLRLIAWVDLLAGIAGAAFAVGFIPLSMVRVGNVMIPVNISLAIVAFLQGLFIFTVFQVIAGAAEDLHMIRKYGIDEPAPVKETSKAKAKTSKPKAEPKPSTSTLGLT
jgi:hypothetical protein